MISFVIALILKIEAAYIKIHKKLAAHTCTVQDQLALGNLKRFGHVNTLNLFGVTYWTHDDKGHYQRN